MSFEPRAQQKQVLDYRGGLMGVSAVPGSGKTMTISALAAELIARGLPADSQVLVVTYQNAAVDTVRARIAAELKSQGMLHAGYDVRTLHSLSYTIIQANPGLAGTTTDFSVLDGRAQASLLRKAVRIWNNQNRRVWESLFPEGWEGDYFRKQWPDIIQNVARTVISTAKNQRLGPNALREIIIAAGPDDVDLFLRISSEIYHIYQQQVQTVGGLDFDDLVWLAVELLEDHPDLRERLRRRWLYVLEDEAQDSVPLQEDLLSLLVGDEGNWVRVGDPNQAIMNTFTAADPKYLRRFLEREDVDVVTLPVSGRSSPKIIDLANHLVDWVHETHPVAEVRERSFRHQMIRPTAPDDPQQNPSEDESIITFRTFPKRDAEFRVTARRAKRFTESHPHLTVGMLVPTNRMGYEMADELRAIRVDFDEVLRSSASSRQVAEVLSAVLAFLANPLKAGNLETAYDMLRQVLPDVAGADDPERVATLLRSSSRIEALVFPTPGVTADEVVPPIPGVTEADIETVTALSRHLQRWTRAVTLPVDQLLMTIAQDVFIDAKLATAQKLAAYLRNRAEQNVDWRLPELSRELELIATGRSGFTGLAEEEYGFEPAPGRITLTTMHRAKGLEWDLVYLVGVDGSWFPHTLDDQFMGEYEALGGDPSEEAKAALLTLIGELELDSYSATETAHIEVIAERLRLLYVGITRARRYLSVSWSREVQYGMRFRMVQPAEAFLELRAYHNDRDGSVTD